MNTTSCVRIQISGNSECLKSELKCLDFRQILVFKKFEKNNFIKSRQLYEEPFILLLEAKLETKPKLATSLFDMFGLAEKRLQSLAGVVFTKNSTVKRRNPNVQNR